MSYSKRGEIIATAVLVTLFLAVLVTLFLAVLASLIFLPFAQAKPQMNYPTAVQAEQAFISQYEQKHGAIEDLDLEHFLIEEATKVCAQFVDGQTVLHIWDAGVQDGLSSDQSATVLDLAIQVYCPQFTDRLVISDKLP